MRNVDICGILEPVNPVNIFSSSKIPQIKGNVIVKGNASQMFAGARNSDISGWGVSKVTNMS